MGYSARQKKVKIKIEGATRKKIAQCAIFSQSGKQMRPGADKLIKRLKDMEDEASNVLMDGAKAGGKIALEDAVRNCPEDTGALKASLKLSENKKTVTRADVKVDYDKAIIYGVFVELGARGRPSNPFLRNAVDNNQNQINKAIVEEVSKAVGRKM